MNPASDSARFVAQRVQHIPRSGIRDFFEIVQSMSDVISLGIGEPDYVTPWRIREAAIFALEKGRTGYTSNLGLPRLRQVISRYLERRYGLTYQPEAEVLVSVGVSEALDVALRATLNAGDEVIYHEPSYVSYSPSIALAGASAVAVRTRSEDAFRLGADALRACCTSRTKALLLSFPTNPTGGVLEGEDLAAVAEVCREHDLLVFADEIYCELVYDGLKHTSIASLPGMRDRTIVLNGCSKSYAMTGFRVGYACAPAPIIEAMMKVHQYAIMCAPNMSQEAAIEALENCDREVATMRSDYEQRRNFVVSRLNAIGLPCHSPKGTFYVFPDITPTGLSSREFALQLLHAQKVAVVPGTAFGSDGEGFVRCCFATGIEQLREAMNRIEQFVEDVRARPDFEQTANAATYAA